MCNTDAGLGATFPAVVGEEAVIVKAIFRSATDVSKRKGTCTN